MPPNLVRIAVLLVFSQVILSCAAATPPTPARPATAATGAPVTATSTLPAAPTSQPSPTALPAPPTTASYPSPVASTPSAASAPSPTSATYPEPGSGASTPSPSPTAPAATTSPSPATPSPATALTVPEIAATAVAEAAGEQCVASGPKPAKGFVGNPVRGQMLFVQRGCSSCHGDQAQGLVGPKLAGTTLPFGAVIQQLREPRGVMQRYLPTDQSDADECDVYIYVKSLKA